MGLLAWWLLWALGLEGCWAMDGSVGGAASASSGALRTQVDSGTAASGRTGRSIHGHVAQDGEEMEDALLQGQMEWLQQHTEVPTRSGRLGIGPDFSGWYSHGL